MPGSNQTSAIWLNTADLAARYRTDEGTVRYWRHTGYGPKGTLIGRRVLYRLSDVEKWEREREQAEPSRRESARKARNRAGAA